MTWQNLTGDIHWTNDRATTPTARISIHLIATPRQEDSQVKREESAKIREKKMIARLHHAQITIPKGTENQARAFYCGLLGLQEMEKPDSLKNRGGFWLVLGDVQIHIGTEDGVERERTKAHLAYQVDNVPAWYEKLTGAGIQIGDSIPIPGHDRFEFRDPFGNRVELIQPL